MTSSPGAAAPATAPARTLRRLLALVVALLLATAFAWAHIGTTDTASAAINGTAVEQCNGILNDGGQGFTCSVIVENFLDLSVGAATPERAVVTIRQCSGSAGVPEATCVIAETTNYAFLITEVDQCNGSGSGAGGVALCSVAVINTITGGTETPTTATVKQCDASGAPDYTAALRCSSMENTTNATINQCNGSTNGGGSFVTCSVNPLSTQTRAVPVSINQCNGSANGGGSVLTCSASIENRILPAVVPTAVPTPSGTPTAVPTPSDSPTPVPTPSGTPTGTPSGTPSATPGGTPPVTPGGTPPVTPPSSPLDGTPGATPSPTPAPPLTPRGGGSGEGADSEGLLAETGVASATPLFFGAALLLFAGSLVLLTRNIQRKSDSVRGNSHTTH
ncbi:hypothetical protein B0I08_10124 [Glaciihabitans tibetensis]|uniref:LPXTG-motif cell wall-anchored protein n=1 Tax=Glaciihabitans tibetensis TaxID=1266600 RepID=A0A2T0VI61_9MICO|nr:hypothetical protein [Glaciihabitans tibetensis]PRY69902.1 hypothetical protein B0I08_10124 [Glaciihabitans tibetensis]